MYKLHNLIYKLYSIVWTQASSSSSSLYGKYAWLAIHLFMGQLSGVTMATGSLSGTIVKLSNEKIRKYHLASPSSHPTFHPCLILSFSSQSSLPYSTSNVSLSPCSRRWLEESRSSSSLRAVNGGGCRRCSSTRRLGKVVRATEGTWRGARRSPGGGGERAGAKMDKVSSNPLQPRHRGSPVNFQINEAIFFGITSRRSDALTVVFHDVGTPRSWYWFDRLAAVDRLFKDKFQYSR